MYTGKGALYGMVRPESAPLKFCWSAWGRDPTGRVSEVRQDGDQKRREIPCSLARPSLTPPPRAGDDDVAVDHGMVARSTLYTP